MKNVIYYTVHVLCSLPIIAMTIISILIFINCYQYRWLCLVLPITCVVVFKLACSYKTDVISTLKFIEKLEDDFDD